jgi:hypothetical protein
LVPTPILLEGGEVFTPKAAGSLRSESSSNQAVTIKPRKAALPTLAANRRYLDALAVVNDPAPAYRQVRELTEPVVVSGRSHAGFNPASPSEVRLFQTVLDGDHLLEASATPRSERRCTDRSSMSANAKATRSDAEAIARSRVDREGATQPSVARQREKPSGAWSGRAPES